MKTLIKYEKEEVTTLIIEACVSVRWEDFGKLQSL